MYYPTQTVRPSEAHATKLRSLKEVLSFVPFLSSPEWQEETNGELTVGNDFLLAIHAAKQSSSLEDIRALPNISDSVIMDKSIGLNY